MDYSKMTDQEIAANVLIAQGYKMIVDGYGYSIYISDSGRKDTDLNASKQFIFDPCNNAADAWPIIESRFISLQFLQGNWMASVNPSQETGFRAACFIERGNPLRAAMIVYLMMRENDKP